MTKNIELAINSFFEWHKEKAERIFVVATVGNDNTYCFLFAVCEKADKKEQE